ncbi:Hypothetical protein Tpal_1187 [Trichococcus palustris]|uniref:Uncharacterized protein n=1 Tax=Trichococcus palustris TaxID=140314 RepID=A0A143YL03_9LACT|nr:Hypothetical protein Tpal_1187 [Trichococcus palustris]SFK98636.1 hypothetical protein SAMN04488076_11230 [Trichococcus palustris]
MSILRNGSDLSDFREAGLDRWTSYDGVKQLKNLLKTFGDALLHSKKIILSLAIEEGCKSWKLICGPLLF